MGLRLVILITSGYTLTQRLHRQQLLTCVFLRHQPVPTVRLSAVRWDYLMEILPELPV